MLCRTPTCINVCSFSLKQKKSEEVNLQSALENLEILEDILKVKWL